MASVSPSTNGTQSALPAPYWPKSIDPLFLVPILLCNAFSYILLGALVVQVSYYLRRYKKDSRRLRALITGILVANLFHVAVQISRDVDVLALGFGDFTRLGELHSKPQNLILPTVSVIIITTNQTIIATRSYLFCRSLAAGRASLRDLAWTAFKALLILASLSCGIGAVVATASYSDLFARGKDNDFHLVGSKIYPLFEMLWLLFGTAADVSIAWSMWSDARKAKTGYQTSSDSVLQVLINVALRCGAVLALIQTLLNVLYFADTPTWAEGAHSLLPRVSSLTVLYSITSPREAYRAFVRRQDRIAAAGTSSSAPAGRVLDSFELTENSLSPEGGGIGHTSRGSATSRVRSLKRAVGFGSKGGGGRVKISFVGVGRSRNSGRIEGHEEDQAWLEEGGQRRLSDRKVEKEQEEVVLTEQGGRGPGGGGRGGTSSVIVQTTSVVSVERVSDEGRERLGNSVTIQGLNSLPPPPPSRPRFQHQNHHLLRLGSSTDLRRERSSRRNLNQTTSDPHPLRSHSLSSHCPSNRSSPSAPNFIDSFPSRPTVTSSIGTYDQAEVDEMFDLPVL